MFNKQSAGFKKIVFTFCVTIFMAAQVLAAFVPIPAKAQGAPDVVAALGGQWSKEAIVEGLLASSMGALVNGFSYFMRKLAYDSAVWIAHGGKGQGALVFQQGAGDYFKSVALDSAATAIEQFGSPLGLNLCKPPDLKFQIFLQVNLRKLYGDPSLAGGPQPKCSWNDFTTNWEKGFENFDEKRGDFMSNMFAKSLKVDQSDMGVALGFVGKVDRINSNAKKAADTSRLEGEGFKAVTDLISGSIKTPAKIIGLETEALTSNNQQKATSQQVAGLYGASLWQVIPAAAGVFLNTLVSQFMDRVINEGLFPSPEEVAVGGTIEGAASIFNEYAGVISNNRAAAENAFSFLFTAVPTQELTTYALMEQFSDCSNPNNPGLNNCVADPGIVQAVKQAETNGQALTIQQAIDRKMLRGDWALVPPQHEYNSDVRRCYNSGYYCYSNIQKMRKARIFPLGFEIAASKANPDDLQAWTLDKIVKGYYDCDPSGEPTPNHPFCHLIDPDWIVRLPEARCESLVTGPKLLSNDNAERRQECADISTCLAEDEKGNCISGYGYCLREKNTWQFQGSSCPQQFSSCSTYTNLKDDTRVSYLSRTLQVGQCDAQSVGCQPFSVTPNLDGTWKNTSQPATAVDIVGGKNSVIHFNESIKNYSCPATAEGCSALLPVAADGTLGAAQYYKKAPATLFEGCYLVNKTGSTQKKWPDTAGEIAELAARPAAKLCAPFAPACTKDDVGCEKYTPVIDSDPDAVTGIVGSNLCRSECVGYDTFKQEQPVDKGAFEPAVFPLQFIPDMADSCNPSYEGCTEFTNIDAANAGGERVEYYSDLSYCEKPTITNQKTFYSWEGTKNEGFVLNTHKLRPILNDSKDRYHSGFISSIVGNSFNRADGTPEFGAGSPAYAEFNIDVLSELYQKCNATAYDALVHNPHGLNIANPDCRAFYDDQANVSYRLLSKTVAVSAACHPLRKTESFLYQEKYLTQLNQESFCVAKGGKWTPENPATTDISESKCEVCYNGGLYQNGSCVYWTTSQEVDNAKSCPQTANNCRAYSGKAENKTQNIIDNNFDPINSEPSALVAAKSNWNNGAIKPESVTVGASSLEVNVNTIDYVFATSTLETGQFYELSFWSRGFAQNLDIQFFDPTSDKAVGVFTYDPVTKKNVRAPISSTWQAYRLGPVQFTGDGTNNIVLRITRTGVSGAAGAYYLDTFKLVKIQEKTHLIKNSWKRSETINGQRTFIDVPLTCDANPGDGLPGAALGCRAYTDSQSRPVNATGFDRLCRVEAVGCNAFVDTRNIINETQAVGYNLWCTPAPNTATCTLTANTVTLGTCIVPPGQVGCYVKQAVIPSTVTVPAAAVKESTVIIPADTAATDPIYLAARGDFACDSANLGCQKIGLQQTIVPNSTSPSAYKFTEYTFKNNPANYGQILCAKDQIGCGAFKSNDTVAYFKDPTTSGAPICSYKEKVEVNGTAYQGWFQDGIGKCTNSNNTCKQDSDCGVGGSCPSTSIGTVPCYSNYTQAGANYGIWSNQSPQYTGAAGRCPDQYNQCQEIIDPLDRTATAPAGKPYYVIFNQKLLNNVGDCNGKVNLKNGCALFDVTTNPTKLFNATETYKITDGLAPGATAKYNPAAPVTTGTLDSNTLLKVDRNRSCSEWLACKDKVRVTDKDGKTRTLCAQYKACRSTEAGVDCTEWSPAKEAAATPLTESVYVQRNVTWYGEDYSGYSIYNKFQAADMVSLSFDGNPIAYLGYYLDPANYSASNDPSLQEAASCQTKSEWTKCGVDEGGRCYEKRCVYPLNGAFPEGLAVNKTEIVKYLEIGSCKAFPEKTSPYSDSVSAAGPVLKVPAFDAETSAQVLTRKEYQQKTTGFEGANICQSGDCSCEYKKITYRDGETVDYREINQEVHPEGVCSSGDKNGKACRFDKDCTTSAEDSVISTGVCSKVKDVENHTGLRGFCLEDDLSRPINRQKNEYACLTWLPVDTAATNFDLFNKYPEAGYYPLYDSIHTSAANSTSQNGKVYCTNASGLGLGSINKDVFINTATFPFNRFNSYNSDASSVPSATQFKAVTYSLAQRWAWLGHEVKPLPASFSKKESKLVQKNGDPLNENSYYVLPPYMDPAEFDKTVIKNQSEVANPTYPNSVVLFTSALHYDSYFRTVGTRNFTISTLSDEEPVENCQKFQDPDTGEVYDADCQKSQGISLCQQTPYEGNCKRVTYAIGPDLTAGLVLKSTDPKNFGANYNVINSVVLHESEISRFRFGPIIAPPKMMKPHKVLTVDFDQLNSEPEETRTSPAGVTYKYRRLGTFNNEHGYFAFKVTPTTGGSIGETRYGIIALSDSGTALNTMPDTLPALTLDQDNKNKSTQFSLFDEVLDAMADRAAVDFNTEKMKKWVSITSHSYLGIYLNFSADNKYLGSSYRLDYEPAFEYLLEFFKPTDPSTQKATPYFAVIADLKPRCTQFTEVYNVDPKDVALTTNKAYTNKVWNYGSNTYDLTGFGIKRTVKLPPFASTPLNSNFTTVPDWRASLRSYVFDSIDARGAFLGCAGEALEVKLGSNGQPLFKQDLAARVYGLPFWQNALCYKNSSDPTYKKIISSAILNTSIKNIFRKAFSQVTYTTSTWNENNSGFDFSAEKTAETMYSPQIYGLKTAKCFGTDNCTAGKADAFTLNRRNGVTDLIEDVNQDGLTDPLISRGSFSATLNFFGFADHNRMPIKRVMIDWGDTTITNQKRYGEYKNRKPFCLDNDSEDDPSVKECSNAPQLTCKSDSDCPSGGTCTVNGHNFGNSSRACQAGYFEFIHSFTCSQSDKATGKAYVKNFGDASVDSRIWAELGRQNYNVTLNPFVCIFQPKVQIQDNWGWCTGKCSDSNNDGKTDYKDGCYGPSICEFNSTLVNNYISNPLSIVVIP